MNGRWGDTPELFEVFREEATDRLASLDSGLLALERSPADTDTVEQIRRDAHSIKGSAKLLGFDDVSEVAHRMEDLLLALADRSIPMSSEAMDALLAGCDTLRGMVDDPTGPVDTAPVIAALEARLAHPAETEVAASTLLGQPEAAARKNPQPSTIGVSPPHDVPRMSVIDLGSNAADPDTTPGEGTGLSPAGNTASERKDGPGHVRLDAGKVYELIDAVGEAVVAHARIEEEASRLAALVRDLESAARRLCSDESLRPSDLADLVRTVREEFADLSGEMGETVDESRKRMELVQAAASRLAMLPTSRLFSPLPRLVRDLSHSLGKDVDLEIDDADAELDKQVLERVAEPVRALIINALDHGIENPEERVAAGKPPRARVTLRARQQGGQVAIEVEDDGRGIDPARIHAKGVAAGIADPDEPLDRADIVRLLFSPGFSTAGHVTDISGRGVGLDIVREAVDSLRGGIEVESEPGRGTRFTLTLPTTMAIVEAVLVRVGDLQFTIPVTAVEEVLALDADSIRSVAGRNAVVLRDQVLTLVSLGETLGVPTDEELAGDLQLAEASQALEPEEMPVVVLSHSGRNAAFRVDALSGRREIMLKELGGFLGNVVHVAGATILGDGAVVPVLDPASLLEAVRRNEKGAARVARPHDRAGRKRLLVVDDSRPIREMLKSILDGAEFEVVLANDGVEAVATFQAQRFDAVVTDVEMPHMSGVDVCAQVRRTHPELPVVMLTSLASEEQRRAGLDAGADAYVTKSEFDQATFVGLVKTLVG